MLKRKISFINFTVIVCGLIIAAGTICLLLMQKNLIKEDTKYLAYTELAQEVKRAKKNIGFDENENPYIKSDFYDLEEKDTYNENVYVFLQSRDGSFLDGRMPDDFRTGLDIGLQSLTKVTFQGERYYVATRRGKMKNGTEDDSFYLVCAMISEQAVKDNYRGLWHQSYLVIGVVGAFFILFALLLRYLIAVPMRQLNESIKKSGENLDFTDSLEYKGCFKELQMLTDANNHLYQRVQQELERQEEFNANVSHELRTPIAVMHAQCQVSREVAEKKQDKEAIKSIEVFERQTNRMKNLVDQLLQMTAIDRKETTFSIEDIDVRDVIESACDDIAYIDTKHITFEYSLQPTIIQANMNLIYIVINNLLSNAVKYSNEGAKIYVSCGEKDGKSYIRIQDEGCGIEKENISKIFESFYREKKDRNAEGFGLGLSQAMKIAELYGGGIYVESTKNKGSIFTFFIPKP